MNNTSINATSTGYRRGVIFGLTMAEVLLLLIFCLLLFINQLNDRLKNVQTRLDDSETYLSAAQRRLEVVQGELLDLQTADAKAKKIVEVQRQLAEVQIQLTKALTQRDSADARATKIVDVQKQLTEVQRQLTEVQAQRDSAVARVAGFEEQIKKTVPIDDFDLLTTIAETSVSREIYDALNNLSDEQVKNTLDNSDILANYTRDELEKLTTRAPEQDPETAKRHALSEEVDLNELELLKEGKMEIAGNNWPPIISLADAENFSFEVGSANLTEKFKADLKAGIANQIYKTLLEYDADVIEVIGHTDLQRMNQNIRTSNLDDQSLSFFQSIKGVELSAKDNAGLGFARALSVTKELSKISLLDGYTILPYSAAQLITPNESINIGENEFESSQLRRIEIRVRRKINKKN
tara:strand:- start:134 stop:1360 length:1227 start_codon:yes stop_codon:yes gene_type:complete